MKRIFANVTLKIINRILDKKYKENALEQELRERHERWMDIARGE